jgi:hypothetical protein
MPFSKEQKKDIQGQVLKVLISGNLPYTTLKDPEMKEFIHMMCTQAVKLLPGPRLASEKLLDNAAKKVEADLLTKF